MNTSTLFYIVGSLALILIGCIMGYYGVASLRKSLRLQRKGILTTGTFKGNKRVEFVTESGMKLVIRSQYRDRSTTFSIGQKVPVLYDPQHPGIACIGSFEELAMAPAGLLWAGAGCIVMGVVVLLTTNLGLSFLGLVATLVVGVIVTVLHARHVAGILQARSKSAPSQ